MRIFVIYDIADPKRLNRVARILKDYGTRVQKSKFEVDVNKSSYKSLHGRIAETIDDAEEGVKYIPLCERCFRKTEVIGQGVFIDSESEFVAL